jgi:cytochrome c
MNTHIDARVREVLIRLAFALALAGMIGSAAAAGESGREIYERQCRTCHGGTAPADSPIGPSLVGIIGTKAGTQPSGVHSRAFAESGIVWNRELLRRFLTDPRREFPGTIMPLCVSDPETLERLLDHLESLR